MTSEEVFRAVDLEYFAVDQGIQDLNRTLNALVKEKDSILAVDLLWTVRTGLQESRSRMWKTREELRGALATQAADGMDAVIG